MPELDIETIYSLCDAVFQMLLLWFLVCSPLRAMRKAQCERDRREAEFRKAVLERLDEQNDLLASALSPADEG